MATLLREQAVRSRDGSATWIAPQYASASQCLQLRPMGHGLYDGRGGVALFLAALERVTGGAGFRELALGALQPLRHELRGSVDARLVKSMGIGGIVGIGSVVYVLVRTSQFLEEPALLEDAKRAAALITSDRIAEDDQFDVISGAAGTILGLLVLYDVCGSSQVLEQAIACGHHLLRNRTIRDTGSRAWATLRKELLTGFAHGSAGIAFALLRLYRATGETDFLEAAREGILYERSVFQPEMGNWPDFRQPATDDRPACMCSWCHGAPGIGLARVAGLDILDTPEIRQDIEAALDTTGRHRLEKVDHLCCGNLGRIEVLFTCGRKLARPHLVDAARERAAQVVARAEQKGEFGYGDMLVSHPGFFQGAAGIGYELLRLTYPEMLPSVPLGE